MVCAWDRAKDIVLDNILAWFITTTEADVLAAGVLVMIGY